MLGLVSCDLCIFLSVVNQIPCDQGIIAETCYGYLECQNKIVNRIQSFEKARDDMR